LANQCQWDVCIGCGEVIERSRHIGQERRQMAQFWRLKSDEE